MLDSHADECVPGVVTRRVFGIVFLAALAATANAAAAIPPFEEGGLSLSVRDSAVVLSDAGGELSTYSGVSLADASGKRKPFGWCDFERTGPSSWRARAKPPADWIGEMPTV